MDDAESGETRLIHDGEPVFDIDPVNNKICKYFLKTLRLGFVFVVSPSFKNN